MTQMFKSIVITGMFVMPAMLALSQDLPAPPPPSSASCRTKSMDRRRAHAS